MAHQTSFFKAGRPSVEDYHLLAEWNARINNLVVELAKTFYLLALRGFERHPTPLVAFLWGSGSLKFHHPWNS